MEKNDFINIIKTRRSVRQYSDKDIPKEMIEKIVECGMYAPSARNQQIWEFIIIDDKNILKRISEINPFAKMAENSKFAILVLANLNLETCPDFWPQDCSAAVQNILLTAHYFGFGCVWTGIYPREDKIESFKELFNLPDKIIPFGLIPIGYPMNEKNEVPDRFNKERIYYNKFGNKYY